MCAHVRARTCIILWKQPGQQQSGPALLIPPVLLQPCLLGRRPQPTRRRCLLLQSRLQLPQAQHHIRRHRWQQRLPAHMPCMRIQAAAAAGAHAACALPAAAAGAGATHPLATRSTRPTRQLPQRKWQQPLHVPPPRRPVRGGAGQQSQQLQGTRISQALQLRCSGPHGVGRRTPCRPTQ